MTTYKEEVIRGGLGWLRTIICCQELLGGINFMVFLVSLSRRAPFRARFREYRQIQSWDFRPIESCFILQYDSYSTVYFCRRTGIRMHLLRNRNGTGRVSHDHNESGLSLFFPGHGSVCLLRYLVLRYSRPSAKDTMCHVYHISNTVRPTPCSS